MRILMLAQFYPPIIGGEENHVRNLSRALVARGHSVSVATLWHPGVDEYEEDGELRIFRIRGTAQRGSMLYKKDGRRHAPPIPDPETVWALRRIIKQERPEIVHAHNWLVHSFIPLKRWSQAKLVMTLHSYGLVCAKHNLIYQGNVCDGPGFSKCLACASEHYGQLKGTVTTLANWAMNGPQTQAVDIFLPVSRAVADGSQLDKHHLPYQVVSNFIADDSGLLEPCTFEGLQELPPEGYILFVGDLTRLKGIEVLFNAYAKLQHDHQGEYTIPPLVVIGRETSDTPKDPPPNVKLFRSWPHQAVMHAWSRAMIGVAPSIWADPCPTVVMEAMALGSPVVGSRIGGLVDLVNDGETGILFPPRDSDALAQALHRLLTEPGLRDRMAAASKIKVAELQAGAIVPRIEQIYRELHDE